MTLLDTIFVIYCVIVAVVAISFTYIMHQDINKARLDDKDRLDKHK